MNITMDFDALIETLHVLDNEIYELEMHLTDPRGPRTDINDPNRMAKTSRLISLQEAHQALQCALNPLIASTLVILGITNKEWDNKSLLDQRILLRSTAVLYNQT
jgi:hypothetical protein